MQKLRAKISDLVIKTIIFLFFVTVMSTFSPTQAHSVENVKDCINPEHYGVSLSADINNKKHEGDKKDSCYSKEERDKDVKIQFLEWQMAVKEANDVYTQKYNAYALALKEKIKMNDELSIVDEDISKKQEELNRIVAYSYKQNYSGSLMSSFLTTGDFQKTLNLKKYLDSTYEYMKKISNELEVERNKKQEILNKVQSKINSAKSELLDTAYHINDRLPESNQELKDYIDENSRVDYKSGRELVDRDLSDDWLGDVALFFVGTPYVWGGKGECGADCSGFTSMVYKKALTEDIGANTTDQFNNLDHIEKKDLKRNDILFMENQNNSSQEHVGIFLEGNTYIHSSGSGTLARVDSGIDYFSCGLRQKQTKDD